MSTVGEPKLTQLVVAVADAKISSDPDSVLVTHSLGSCIGVCLYDASRGMGGLLHYQLPTSSLDPARAQQQPLMFADTGLAMLLDSMQAHGATASRISVKLAGGAEMLNDSKLFSIGRRNYTAIRKLLWGRGLMIQKEDVGGTSPRTVYLRVADGAVTIRSNGTAYEL